MNDVHSNPKHKNILREIKYQKSIVITQKATYYNLFTLTFWLYSQSKRKRSTEG